MEKNIYCVKDNLVGFGKIFDSYSDATAIREITMAVNSPRGMSLISDRPEDFSLYKIGTFNTDTGVFTPCLEFICNAPGRSE